MGATPLIAIRHHRSAEVHELAAATGRLAEALRELDLAREAAAAGFGPPGGEAPSHEILTLLARVVAKREALGIRDHEGLCEVLRVPPDLRSLLRRRGPALG